MQLKLAKTDPAVLLECGQVCLVMRIVEPVAAGGRGQLRQPGADSAGGEVLDLAVVFVPPAVLPRFRKIEPLCV